MDAEHAAPGHRSAWLDIDLAAIEHNVDVIADLVGPGVGLAAVVKADAYGHGLVPVAQTLDERVEALCVATLDEGLALREAGVVGRVLMLYPVPGESVGEAVGAGLELTVMSAVDVDAAIAAGLDGGAEVRVHLAVETGFHRGGIAPREVTSLAGRMEHAAGVQVVGVWSHLAAPEDASSASLQIDAFEQVVADLRRNDIHVPGHLIASGGIFMGRAPELTLVRPGLALYGELDRALPLGPTAAAAAARLRPAMTLSARPIAVADVPSGGRVGYSGTWRAGRPSRVATLPVGYGDGFARTSQPGGEAIVRGRRVPLVGVVSMDSVGVDVTDVPDAGPDDVFVLLGRQGDERISASDLARRRTTITWEVLTGMAARLDRVYHRGAELTPPWSRP